MEDAFVDVDKHCAMVVGRVLAELGSRSGDFVALVEDNILSVIHSNIQLSRPLKPLKRASFFTDVFLGL